MITLLDLSRYRRARIWDGECPGARYEIGNSLRGEVEASTDQSPPRRIAVEIVVPKGPMVSYGLLGGEFRPLPGRSTLGIITYYSEERFGVGDPFESPIAVAPEEPVVGLPLELARAALAGVQDTQMRGVALSPGTLTIDCAAYGVFGSSPAWFRSLASVLTALLCRGWTSDPDLRQGIEAYLAVAGQLPSNS